MPPGRSLLHDPGCDARPWDTYRWTRATCLRLPAGQRRLATAAEQRPGAVGPHWAQVGRGGGRLRQWAAAASRAALRRGTAGSAWARCSAHKACRCPCETRPGPAGWALPVARAGTGTAAASSCSSASSAAWAGAARAARCTTVACTFAALRASAIRSTTSSSSAAATEPSHASSPPTSLEPPDQLLQLVKTGE